MFFFPFFFQKKRNEHLLGALVDTVEEVEVDFVRNVLDILEEALDISVRLFLVRLEICLNVHVDVQLLDHSLLLLVLEAVVGFEDGTLSSVRLVQSSDHEPRALVVLDVGTNLADDAGIRVAIQVVILHLEVLTHDEENLTSLSVGRGRGDATHDESASHRQVEGVESCLITNDLGVTLHGETVQILRAAKRLGGEVEQLAEFSLARGLEEEVDELVVVHLQEQIRKTSGMELDNVGSTNGKAYVVTEVTLQDLIHNGLENEGVVDGDHLNVLKAVPAGLATAGHGVVHDVVSHKEESLQKLKAPTQSSSLATFLQKCTTDHERYQTEDLL